ncbi:MAG: AhpC/TSA family protein [Bacteroidaceae bacterium]|nr:AhpC/TSA family protein [Bacteroidaceae bacterium]
MKKTLITALLVLSTLVGQAQEKNFTLSCDVTPLLKFANQNRNVTITDFYLNNGINGKRVAETDYKGDSIVVISGKIETPLLVEFVMESEEGGFYALQLIFFLEPGNIVLKIDNLRDYIAEGTPLNDAYFSAQKEIKQANREGKEEKAQQLVLDYIRQHKDDITAVKMLENARCKTKDDAKQFLALISQCSEEVQLHKTTKYHIERFNKKLDGPQKFIDFTVEYEGQKQSLSDYVGKGQYVMVDFWGSWCGACKAAMPKVIALHEKYKDKNFTALGVAVNEIAPKTLEAVKKLNIPFPQILNTGQKALELYDLQYVPHYILFGPDATVLAQGIDFDKMKAKLAEILGD